MATLFYIFNSTVIDWTCLILFATLNYLELFVVLKHIKNINHDDT